MASSSIYSIDVRPNFALEFAKHRIKGNWWIRAIIKFHPQRWDVVQKPFRIEEISADTIKIECRYDQEAIAGEAKRQHGTYARLPLQKEPATLKPRDMS